MPAFSPGHYCATLKALINACRLLFLIRYDWGHYSLLSVKEFIKIISFTLFFFIFTVLSVQVRNGPVIQVMAIITIADTVQITPKIGLVNLHLFYF